MNDYSNDKRLCQMQICPLYRGCIHVHQSRYLQGGAVMVGSIEPFIRGLYNVAPKCIECGEMREYWDDELCVKCRRKKEQEEENDNEI